MVSEWGILWLEDEMFPLSRINAVIYPFHSLTLSLNKRGSDWSQFIKLKYDFCYSVVARLYFKHRGFSIAHFSAFMSNSKCSIKLENPNKGRSNEEPWTSRLKFWVTLSVKEKQYLNQLIDCIIHNMYSSLWYQME